MLVLLLQATLNGLTTGMIYVVVALGLTLIFGVMFIINFAHGALYMLGAFAVWLLFTSVGVPYWLALIISMFLIAIAGIIIERFLYRPFRGQLLRGFIVAMGIATILPHSISLIFGGRVEHVPTVFPGLLKFGAIVYTTQRLVMVLACIALVAALFLFIRHSKAGKAMRAVAQDPEAATLQGISIDHTSSLCMAIGCALAAAAAGLVVPLFALDPWIGEPVIMRAFVIIIVGGLGSIPGAVLGGLILGFIESIGALFVRGPIVSLFGFILIIVILLLRPRGLLGHV